MSNQSDYQALLDTISSITNEETKTPGMPMDTFHQEGDNLAYWIKEDAEKLMAAGVSRSLLEELSKRVGASREAQSIWNKEFNSRKDAEQLMSEKSPEAFDLRDMLIHTFKYAFRKDEGLLAVVDKIAEGGSREDMIQDLNDLAVLGRQHPEKLENISFDITNIEKASKEADEMGELLGAVNGDRNAENPALLIRNKAYTYCKEAMDEIRQAGKYIFWKDKARLKGYTSAYYRRFN